MLDDVRVAGFDAGLTLHLRALLETRDGVDVLVALAAAHVLATVAAPTVLLTERTEQSDGRMLDLPARSLTPRAAAVVLVRQIAVARHFHEDLRLRRLAALTGLGTVDLAHLIADDVERNVVPPRRRDRSDADHRGPLAPANVATHTARTLVRRAALSADLRRLAEVFFGRVDRDLNLADDGLGRRRRHHGGDRDLLAATLGL